MLTLYRPLAIAVVMASGFAPSTSAQMMVFDTFATNQFLFKDVKYGPLKDFVPVMLVGRSAQALAVHPQLGVRTLPGFETQGWLGLIAPAGTPRAILERVHGAMIKVLGSPEVKGKFEALGYEVVASTPAEFGEWIRSEMTKWGRVVREQKIALE